MSLLLALLGDVPQHTIEPVGIASAEALGAVSLNGQLAPAGVASAEALGVVALRGQVAPAGIAGAEALGAAAVNGTIAPAGVASAELLGEPSVASEEHEIAPAGIPGAEGLGVPTVTQVFAEDFGAVLEWPKRKRAAVLHAVGIPSSTILGKPALRLTGPARSRRRREEEQLFRIAA